MTTPAGWYPDPENGEQLRYWDGGNWTEHRAPGVASPPAATAAPQPDPTLAAAPPPAFGSAAPAPSSAPGPAATHAALSGGGNWFSQHKALSITGGVVAALLVLAGIGAATSGGSGSTSSSATASPSSAATSTEPTPSPTTEVPSETPTPEPSSETPSPPPAPKVFSYSGTGNKILKVALPDPTQAAIMTFTNRGTDGNVTVYSLDDQLQEDDLLVNTIGAYKGVVLINKQGEGTKRVKIDGAGKWTLVIRSLETARNFSSTIAGSSDDVVVYTGPVGIFNFTSRGTDSNVTVYSYDGDGNSDLLVNEIGKVKTQTTIQEGPQVLEINGAGQWTIAVNPA